MNATSLVRICFPPIILIAGISSLSLNCGSDGGQANTASPPAIQLSRTSVSFGATAGNAAVQPETVDITNGGGGSLGELGVTSSYGDAPAGVDWLAVKLDSTTAPATLTLEVATTDLPAGSYGATVWVEAIGAVNSPQEIAVTWEINSSATQ